MSLSIAFLEARTPLAKSFTRDAAGNLVKHSYPHVKRVTSHIEEIGSLKGLADALREHAEEGHCMLKGTLSRDLEEESRAGTTSRTDLTNWICLDLDGLKGISSPQVFLQLLGLQAYSYVLQYSSSMGVDPEKGLSCHIFMEIDEPVMPSRLRAWLLHQNLSLPKLRKELDLSADRMSLRYGLDLSTCDNGKILYIAPPACGEGVKDTFKGERIQYVKRDKEVVPTKALALDSLNPDALASERDASINELREEQGLESREFVNRTYRGEQVLTNPDLADITGYREERGFAYFNLNGGDSWSYYHPLSNPHVIYCFKGEQKFAAKELVPGYLEEQGLERAKEYKKEEKDQAKERAREEYEHSLKLANKKTTGKTWLAFLDVPSDSYYRGYFDHENKDLVLNKTNSLIKIMHFLKDNGREEMDWVPEWSLCFDFMADLRFDAERRVINQYQPSELMKAEQPPKTNRLAKKLPPTIEKVIRHVVAQDQAAFNDFLNWLACIIQRKAFPRTSWVFFGIQGTGKGTLFHKIIAPLIGEQYCQSKLFKDLENDFNGWLEKTIFCMVDEVSIGDAHHKDRLMAQLKNNITEPRVSVRAMRTDSRMVLNNCSYILCSNKPDPVIIEDTDRRFHIAPYQNEKLRLTPHEYEVNLTAELQDFVYFLRALEVDVERARTPKDNETKEHLKHISRSAIDSVAFALHQGDIEFFIDQLPKNIQALENVADEDTAAQARAYREFVNEMIRGELLDGAVRIHRDDLREVLNYLVGKMPSSPNKFTAYLKHHSIFPSKMRVKGKSAQAIELIPQRKESYEAEWKEYLGETEVIKHKVTALKKRRA